MDKAQFLAVLEKLPENGWKAWCEYGTIRMNPPGMPQTYCCPLTAVEFELRPKTGGDVPMGLYSYQMAANQLGLPSYDAKDLQTAADSSAPWGGAQRELRAEIIKRLKLNPEDCGNGP
jgi:hypothetical protein